MFDDVAKHYDRTNAVLSAGNAYLWRIATVRAVAPQPGERILDLAAGTGTSSVALSHSGAKVIAVDFSPGMIEEGRRKHKNIEFVQADIEKLPFGDDEFDAVTISFGLRNVNDPKQALAEMYRVLKPGGRARDLRVLQTSSRTAPNGLPGVPQVRAARPFRSPFRRTRRPTTTWPTRSRTGQTRDNSANGFEERDSCASPTATSPRVSSRCTAGASPSTPPCSHPSPSVGVRPRAGPPHPRLPTTSDSLTARRPNRIEFSS